MSKNSISTNEELFKGDYLLSNNGNYKAVFQVDGTFAIYKWVKQWATSNSGGNRVVMQDDGNLAIYADANKVVWDNKIHQPQDQMMRLTLTDEGRKLKVKCLGGRWC
uniref:Bulb-type lectin domain-containing protein n=1 Tax=Myripristis murdjan TaxID=586833 RepID=A0A667WJ13_9TELE